MKKLKLTESTKDQYNQPPIEDGMPIPAKPLADKSSDMKVRSLEDQLHGYERDLAKLHRDVGRLKDAVSSLENVVNNLNRRG